jgi:hypothetical protein
MTKLKVNNFALLEGQIVQIKRIRPNYGKYHIQGHNKGVMQAQVKLIDDNLLHWVDLEQLQELEQQIASKVLFSA